MLTQDVVDDLPPAILEQLETGWRVSYLDVEFEKWETAIFSDECEAQAFAELMDDMGSVGFLRDVFFEMVRRRPRRWPTAVA